METDRQKILIFENVGKLARYQKKMILENVGNLQGCQAETIPEKRDIKKSRNLQNLLTSGKL